MKIIKLDNNAFIIEKEKTISQLNDQLYQEIKGRQGLFEYIIIKKTDYQFH